MTQFIKGTKVRVRDSAGRKRLGVVCQDQLPMHPYVSYRDTKTGGEHVARIENVEAV